MGAASRLAATRPLLAVQGKQAKSRKLPDCNSEYKRGNG